MWVGRVCGDVSRARGGGRDQGLLGRAAVSNLWAGRRTGLESMWMESGELAAMKRQWAGAIVFTSVDGHVLVQVPV